MAKLVFNVRNKITEKQAACFKTNNEGDSRNMNEIVLWVNQGRQNQDGHAWHNGTNIFIHTLEGWHTADVGDWIIKGVNGEFYPCKPDVFKKSYEVLD